MKFQRRQGFTVVELLTVLAIIAILVGILVPTISFVRNSAREARQSTQLMAIDMALMAFKGDHGDYPSSDVLDKTPYNYCGAQRLAEALVGWDLLGFHPESSWTADDLAEVYNLDGLTEEKIEDNLNRRTGPYLELTTANTFKLSDLFKTFGPSTWRLEPDTYVLCDVFGIKPVSYTTASGATTIVKAGTPILYYKANASSKLHNTGPVPDRIYNALDNKTLTELKIKDPDRPHLLIDDGSFEFIDFYNYITDPKVMAIDWPYRPDSYILISAGVDGLYGTDDDITNF
jgi:prepilin-type N-terminal cleavage/methylation domain-containing protein